MIEIAEKALDEGDSAEAPRCSAAAHDMAPDHPAAAGGLARALIAAGRIDEARAMLDGLDEALQANHAEIARARATLELDLRRPRSIHAPLEAKVAANPDDHDARFELASALMASGDRDRAADELARRSSPRDRDWNEGAARQRFLQLLEAQGLGDPWSAAQRRKLSALAVHMSRTIRDPRFFRSAA